MDNRIKLKLGIDERHIRFVKNISETFEPRRVLPDGVLAKDTKTHKYHKVTSSGRGCYSARQLNALETSEAFKKAGENVPEYALKFRDSKLYLYCS